MRNAIGVAGTYLPRWLAAATLVTVAATASGCGSDPAPANPDAAATSSAVPQPRDVLLAAVPDGDEGPFRFTIVDHEATGSGVVDAASQGIEISYAIADPDLGFTTNMAFRVIDQQSWMKVTFTDAEDITGLPELPETWLLLDPAQVDDAGSLPAYDGPDPANTTTLCQAIVTAEEAGSGQYAGTLDLTQTSAAEVVDPAIVAALGEAAKAVPFTAEVDANEQLASMTIQVPATDASEAYEHTITYGDYGDAPPVTVPSEPDSQEAPPLAYELLNG